MRVLMLPTFFGGIEYWRFAVPAKYLRQVGVEVTCPSADAMDHNVRSKGSLYNWLREEMPKHDLVHAGYSGISEFARTLFTVRDECHVPIITDLDDDLNNVPSYNSGWKTFRPGGEQQRVAKLQLIYSDGVTYSTEVLSQAMTPSLNQLAQTQGVALPPSATLLNGCDPDDWDHPHDPARAEDRGVSIILSGGHGRYGDWQLLRTALETILARFDGKDGRPFTRILFFGATPDWALQWMSSSSDATANRAFYLQPTEADVKLYARMCRWVAPDIWLAPTIHNPFNAAKSNLKYQEAALAGAAFLCTDGQTYADAPTGTCLKADNTDTQWAESIGALIESPSLRTQLTYAAREHVLANMTAETYVSTRKSFYESVLEGFKGASRSSHMVGGSSLHAQPIPGQGGGEVRVQSGE